MFCHRLWRISLRLLFNGQVTVALLSTVLSSTTDQKTSPTLITPNYASSTRLPFVTTTFKWLTITPSTLVTPTAFSSTHAYQEFESLVPPDVYKRLAKVYSNPNLLVVDKLKELDDIFMTLSAETLEKLPTPKAFRTLSQAIQQKVRKVYYSKNLSFENKLKGLEDIMHALPPEELSKIPFQQDLPGLTEFDVPVLLQFNGQIETYLLRQYLNSSEFQTLKRILTEKNLSEVTRARLIGRLLRNAYARDPLHFPMPLGDEDPNVPEEIRRLGIHLMFSKNPFDTIDVFSQALTLLKPKVNNRSSTASPLTASHQRANETARQWSAFSGFVRHFMPSRLSVPQW